MVRYPDELHTPRPFGRRLAALAYWTFPSVFCLWLYWFGLRTWFLQDDFAWLGVNVQIHDWQSFWHAVFVPSQQGTIRPLSERLFFIVFWQLFGWQAFYYRAFVFLTQFFNLALLSGLVWKLSGSRTAGFLAPVLWTANASLAVAMSWTSGYNEILCATFLLVAFFCFLRFQQTGKWRFYAAQVTVFVLGFGALELNIIYPALALCWALLRLREARVSARRLALSTLPLFVLSAAYYAIHRAVAPPQTAGAYAMHFDGALPQTLWTYCQWAFVSPEWVPITQHDARLGTLAACAMGFAVIGFVLYQAWRRHFLPLFFAAWFLITLAPLVPLRDHLSDYYLSIPSLGPAVIGAIAMRAAWREQMAWRVTAVLLFAIYFTIQVPVVRAYTVWHYTRSLAVRDVVLGIESAHKQHPAKTILLADVSPELYDTAVSHRPFRLIPGAEVFLAPDSRLPPSQFTLPGPATARALLAERLEVYSTKSSRLRNITSAYERAVPREWLSEYPRTVDAGNPLVAYVLGREWYSAEGAYRWMPQQATVRLGGPRSNQERLYLTGFCPKPMFAAGPVTVSVAIDGQPAGEAMLAPVEGRFTHSFALPAAAMGKPFLEVRIAANRAFQENGNGRTLAFAFGDFEIR